MPSLDWTKGVRFSLSAIRSSGPQARRARRIEQQRDREAGMKQETIDAWKAFREAMGRCEATPLEARTEGDPREPHTPESHTPECQAASREYHRLWNQEKAERSRLHRAHRSELAAGQSDGYYWDPAEMPGSMLDALEAKARAERDERHQGPDQ
jgi:hypothetical protein